MTNPTFFQNVITNIKTRKLISTIIKIILGAIITFIIFYIIGFDKVIDTLKSINQTYLPAIFVFTILSILFFPVSLFALYHPIQEKNISLKKFYKLRLLTQIFGTLTPNKIGELSLFFILKKKYNQQITPMVGIYILDKLVTIIHAFFFTAIGIYILFNNVFASFVIIGILFALILGSLFCIWCLKRLKSTSNTSNIFTKIKILIREVSKFFLTYSKKYYKYLFLNFVLTFGSFLLTSILGKVVYLSFNIKVPLLEYFLIINMISVISLMPLNMVGFGIREISSIYLFNLIGISPSISASAIILILTVRYLTYLLIYGTVKL